MSLKTAAIIIISDEILKGHVNDANSNYMCKRFHAIGVRVCRITVVPDNADDIAGEVSKFARKYNIVVTSGGIGPTHDYITYEGVAKGLNDRIILDSETASVIRSYFPCDYEADDSRALKMAPIPGSSKLIYVSPKKAAEYDCGGENGLGGSRTERMCSFPIVRVGNVYILPDITELLKVAFDHLQTLFDTRQVSLYTMKLLVNATELRIIDLLNQAVHKYENSVIFGSHPSTVADDPGTEITMESASLDDVTDAYSYLKSVIPGEYLSDELHFKEVESVYELTNGSTSLANAVRGSLKVIELAYAKYKQEDVHLSFNGGKDCTVLLHLIWAFNMKRDARYRINAFYLKSPDTFPEMEDFIQKTKERYNMNLVTDGGPAQKEQLAQLVRKNPTLKAIFLGTRRTDPFAKNLQEFQMCDPDWPQVMRINPLLDWSYSDVWEFLRVLAIPYCTLYDQGYTSLGSVKNTKPNPALATQDADGKITYKPAYTLKQESLERQGRV